MSSEQIINGLLDQGILDNEEQKVSGIAKLAVDKGYDTLSHAQKSVIAPWLTANCSGSTDPGGHHNGCSVELIGDELVDALDLAEDYESIQCESCRSDDSYYGHQYSKLMEK
ncbi:hypothetical protein MT391_16810 [Vibrio sp. 1-Bac 57]